MSIKLKKEKGMTLASTKKKIEKDVKKVGKDLAKEVKKTGKEAKKFKKKVVGR